MPLSAYKRLPNLGSQLQTSMTFQLVDWSIRHPIVKYVHVFMGNLVFPCDFLVMSMPKDAHALIILGRPCLVTIRAVIDVKRDKLTLEVGEKMMMFKLQKSMENALSEKCQSVNKLKEWPFEIGHHVVALSSNRMLFK